jgi:hypothetical protein
VEFTRDSSSNVSGARLSGGRIRNIRYERMGRSASAQNQ